MQRLLPKQEVERRRRDEERQRMDEGLRVAERVDTLRETLASEEAAFERYRVESLKEIQEEIGTARSKRDELLSEVVRLRIEQKALSEPLEALWEDAVRRDDEIEEKVAKVVERKLALDKKALALGLMERQAFSQEKAMEIAERRIAMREAESRHDIEEIEAASEKRRIETSIAAERVYLREVNAKELERSLEKKEAEVLNHENDLILREKKLAKREASLKANWNLLEKTAARITHK